MTAVQITFIGGPGTGNVGSAVWGVPATGRITFPLNVPVTIDPEKENNTLRSFMEHVVAKAKVSRFYRVEDVKQGTKPAELEHPVRASPGGKGKR